MKLPFTYPSSLKNRVIFILALLFFSVWSGFILFSYYKAHHDLLTTLEQAVYYEDARFQSVIDNEAMAMKSIINSISDLYFNNVVHLEQLSPDLRRLHFKNALQSWSTWTNSRYSRFVQHYDMAGHLLNEWGKIQGDQLNSPLLQEAFKRTRSYTFFSCHHVCFLNVTDSAGADTFRHGLLRMGLLVDDVVNNYADFSHFDITLFRNDIPEPPAEEIFTVHEQRYAVETTSSYLIFDQIRPLLNKLSFERAFILSTGKRYYGIRLYDRHDRDGLYYALSTDLTEPYQATIARVFNIALISALLLILALVLFYFFLSRTTRNFETLAVLMEMIGQGNFSSAGRSIPEKYLNLGDELGLMYRTTMTLIQRLDLMKKQLLDSNRMLEQALVEKSREHSFLESILDTSEIAVLVSDETHNISLSNRFSQKLFGHDTVLPGSPLNRLLGDELDPGQVWQTIARQHSYRSHSSLTIRGRRIYLDWIHCAMPEDYGSNKMLSLGVDISRHIELEQEIRYVAEHDGLTRLRTRKKFNQDAQQLLAESEQAAYIAMDLDYFKLLNDSMGHRAGDRLLCEVSGVLLHHAQQHNAIVGRMGGDEFAMLVPHGGKALIQVMLEQILQALSAVQTELNHMTISMSCGVAFYPTDASDPGQLSSHADMAMYENKRLKDRAVNFYTGREKVLSLKLEQQYYASLIRKIIDEELVSLYFQPIIRVKDRQVIGAEILTRIIDPVLGTHIPTEKLVHYAEQTGRIVDIDLQVISKALAYAHDHAITCSLMINLSNLSMSHKSVSDEIHRIILDSGVPCSRIVFEILESSEIDDLNETIHFIRRFRALGVRFALDDFGSGFFSFFYLKVLPVNFLKIDKSIVADIVSDEKNQKIIQAMTQLTQDLDIQVIAEGIESQQVLDAISAYPIAYVQGYYLAKPAPITQFDKSVGQSGL